MEVAGDRRPAPPLIALPPIVCVVWRVLVCAEGGFWGEVIVKTSSAPHINIFNHV